MRCLRDYAYNYTKPIFNSSTPSVKFCKTEFLSAYVLECQCHLHCVHPHLSCRQHRSCDGCLLYKIIRTVLCCIVYYKLHDAMNTCMSNSYR